MERKAFSLFFIGYYIILQQSKRWAEEDYETVLNKKGQTTLTDYWK